MPFSTTSCPNCGQAVSKEAEACPHCGCPASAKYAGCPSCAAAVAIEAKYCWKCGAEQPAADQRGFVFGDRWNRSEGDFAVRVNIALPEKAFGAGLLIEKGTSALLFQDSGWMGTLGTGFHTLESVQQKIPELDKTREAYAVLLSSQASDLRFLVEEVRTQQATVNVRVRLLLQVADHGSLASTLLKNQRRVFTNADLTRHFQREVRDALQLALTDRPLDEIVADTHTRELIEKQVSEGLEPVLARHGLRGIAVRVVDCTGPAMERLRERQTEIARAIVYVRHELEISRLKFDEEIAQNKIRFELSQEQKVAQSRTDLDTAKAGVEALRLVKQAKLDAFAREEAIKTEAEAARLKIREAAGIKALLASIEGAQGDRLLKFAELEMRRGLSAEQALAMVADKNPDIAPTVAAALRARTHPSGTSAP
jgi:RNA polymerase subunit RPABC4/transcription elongation factor Spt4